MALSLYFLSFMGDLALRLASTLTNGISIPALISFRNYHGNANVLWIV